MYVYTHVHTHVYVYTHIYDIYIISNIYCWWIVWSVTFWRLHKRSSFSSSNICSSWRPSLEINRRSNFTFPMLELRILNNDLEIWIPTFSREEVAKWHSLLLSANPISWSSIYNESWEQLMERILTRNKDSYDQVKITIIINNCNLLCSLKHIS